MTKIIAVCGATGQLGGSIARRMLLEGWHVRALTRNVDSLAAEELRLLGAMVVSADFDEPKSLIKVFEGAHAIFGVTNFWEHLHQTQDLSLAGARETEQMLAIAAAAATTPTLQHFILLSIASGEKLAGKDYVCEHWDAKDRACDTIKTTMPELLQRTTFLWVSNFASNLMFTLAKPFEMPHSNGQHVMLLPGPASTMCWITDIEHNVGMCVAAILRHPALTLPGKIVSVHTDIASWGELLQMWSEVTGRPATFIECSAEDYERAFGIEGRELAICLRLNEKEPNWTKGHEDEVVTLKDLEIEKQLLGVRQALELYHRRGKL